jgi:hypothetical protein
MLVHDIKGGALTPNPSATIAWATRGIYCTLVSSIFRYRRRAPRPVLLYDSFATETLLLALLTRGKHHGFKRFAKALGVAHP